MPQNQQAEHGLPALADRGFKMLEHIGYMALGVLLAIAGALALGNAAALLYHAMLQSGAEQVIIESVDRLLVVFMLIEILHTVRASLRSGGLAAEPFLVVGLIASIRRVLVITLQTSQEMKNAADWTPQMAQQLRISLMELAVLAALILAMVVSVFLLHRARPNETEPAGSSV